VILAYQTLAIRDICLRQTKAEAKYGYKVARQLFARMTDLRAADTISELPPVGRPREIPSSRQGSYAIYLTNDYQLVLRVNHEDVPVTKSGKIDWSHVSRVMILGIEVCHD
jgi:plasmid maintenance system killer protein